MKVEGFEEQMIGDIIPILKEFLSKGISEKLKKKAEKVYLEYMGFSRIIDISKDVDRMHEILVDIAYYGKTGIKPNKELIKKLVEKYGNK